MDVFFRGIYAELDQTVKGFEERCVRIGGGYAEGGGQGSHYLPYVLFRAHLSISCLSSQCLHAVSSVPVKWLKKNAWLVLLLGRVERVGGLCG